MGKCFTLKSSPDISGRYVLWRVVCRKVVLDSFENELSTQNPS
jgi:hypothetical protein